MDTVKLDINDREISVLGLLVDILILLVLLWDVLR